MINIKSKLRLIFDYLIEGLEPFGYSPNYYGTFKIGLTDLKDDEAQYTIYIEYRNGEFYVKRKSRWDILGNDIKRQSLSDFLNDINPMLNSKMRLLLS